MLGSTERKVLPMAIEATKKLSDLEKRLSLLRQQVYGKETVSSIKYQEVSKKATDIKSARATTYHLPPTNSASDTTYLYQDLFKISILASCAIGAQLILFILTKNHILNINFI